MKKIFSLSFSILLISLLAPFVYGDTVSYSENVQVINNISKEKETVINKDDIEELTNLADETITVLIDGEVLEMNLEEYLIGVVAAEMPATFDMEALKAQAVAARTYAIYKRDVKSDSIHEDADVCTDSTHCKAYVDVYENNIWGENYNEYYEKVAKAVLETSGEIVTYENEPIVAVFHSISTGKTESAEDIWGTYTPYLISVDTYGDDLSNKSEEYTEISLGEIKQKFKAAYPDIIFDDNANYWFKNSTRSDAGGILEITVGDTNMQGTDVRNILELNSTDFTIEVTPNSIIFCTSGYGHGVGMSQYGAQEMALNGNSYIEILKWYYNGTSITKIF